jgi:Adenylate and Guanylate cyclase catalytic domain
VTAVAAVNGSWPNVTIPSFVAHAGHLLTQSKGASMVLLAPIVTDYERAGWESYAQLVAQKRNIQVNPTIFMFSNGTMTNASFPPFAPIWQVALELDAATNYSQVESLINYDILSVSVIQSQAMDVQELRGGDLSCFLSNDSFANALAPVSSFLEPVFEVLEEKDHGGIVGYLQGQFNWTTEIVDMLQNTDPLYVTLTDSCNQSATWFVNGEESTLLGLDHLIPEEYASHQTTHCISTAPSVNQTHSIHQNETCSFVVGLYPSQEFREAYTSTFPVIYTSVVAIVFCLVVATFLCYDRFVQKRNEKVVRTAARSNAIVSSMFPTAFRDRLYRDSLNGPGDSAKDGLRSFLDFDEAGDTQLASGQPIADLFPDVTLMFADISGFTSWSSVREPAQVFVLLESCFHAFDAIAKRRRIFKVSYSTTNVVHSFNQPPADNLACLFCPRLKPLVTATWQSRAYPKHARITLSRWYVVVASLSES